MREYRRRVSPRPRGTACTARERAAAAPWRRNRFATSSPRARSSEPPSRPGAAASRRSGRERLVVDLALGALDLAGTASDRLVLIEDRLPRVLVADALVNDKSDHRNPRIR